MKIIIQSINPSAWNAIVKGPFIPTKEENGELVPKEWDEIKDDEKRKVQDNEKAKSISTSSLSSHEFFHNTRCKIFLYLFIRGSAYDYGHAIIFSLI